MAVKLTLRKADLEVLAVVDDMLEGQRHDGLTPAQWKAWSSFSQRVQAAEMKPKTKRGAGLKVADAVEIFRGVLGRRLVLPAGQPGPVWYIQLQNRINASGLTKEHLEAAAKVAAAQWRGPVKAESIIRQCDVLLSDANLEMLGLTVPEPITVDMEDL